MTMARIQTDSWLLAALVGVALLVAVTRLLAGETEAGEESHEMARALQQAGDIRSLEEVLVRMRAEHGGRVLEAELEREDGRYLYEIELLDDAGKVNKLFYDARTGEAIHKR
jgi:uncharacterized membrane protein YkoI